MGSPLQGPLCYSRNPQQHTFSTNIYIFCICICTCVLCYCQEFTLPQLHLTRSIPRYSKKSSKSSLSCWKIHVCTAKKNGLVAIMVQRLSELPEWVLDASLSRGGCTIFQMQVEEPTLCTGPFVFSNGGARINTFCPFSKAFLAESWLEKENYVKLRRVKKEDES